MPTPQPLVLFFLQITIILLACRLVGVLIARVGQPIVVGEMIAGILLGPSLFGWVAPAAHAALFPPQSLSAISIFSQIGLVLYMFVVGLHLQTDFMKRALRGALLISLAGICAPFVLGAGLAWFLYSDGRFFSANVSSSQAMTYLGAAMSVTAFPVLARIIQERGIAGTALGTLALAAGATDDVIAWCLLALVLASINDQFQLALVAVAGGVLYAVVVLAIVRPQLAKTAAAVENRGALSGGTLTMVLALLMAGACFTEAIGLHAVFGAFVLGVAMPRGVVAKELSRQIEPVATALLVPLFFAYSGLSTRYDLLWSVQMLMLSVLVVAVASVGKGVACWGASRLAGRPNHEAMALGALMNARGLMELIILNIGLDRGLITPTLFTVMVTMTLVTTLAAGPLFAWVWRGSAEVPDAAGVAVR